jgi:hypothetical protein
VPDYDNRPRELRLRVARYGEASQSAFLGPSWPWSTRYELLTPSFIVEKVASNNLESYSCSYATQCRELLNPFTGVQCIVGPVDQRAALLCRFRKALCA